MLFRSRCVATVPIPTTTVLSPFTRSVSSICAAVGAAGCAGLADRVRREVVVVDVALGMYQKLKQAISSLKPVQREIIKMIYVEGKSQKEVAKELGIAESTLSERVKLIISKLKEKIL